MLVSVMSNSSPPTFFLNSLPSTKNYFPFFSEFLTFLSYSSSLSSPPLLSFRGWASQAWGSVAERAVPVIPASLRARVGRYLHSRQTHCQSWEQLTHPHTSKNAQGLTCTHSSASNKAADLTTKQQKRKGDSIESEENPE